MKKLNVVWLCVTPLAPLNHILKLDKVPQVLAPWITASIDEFKKREDISLSVISVISENRKNYSFLSEGIQYFFIPRLTPAFMKHFKDNFRLDRYINSLYLNWYVHKLIRKIKPDIINLHGTEHDICSTFPGLPGNKILTIQGFINLVYEEEKSKSNYNRLKIENRIFKTTKDFIIQAKFMPDIIKKYNPDAQFHYCQYPSIKPKVRAANFDPDTDLIFVARICKDKGIEDLLEALVEVKKVLPQIKLKIAGKVSAAYEFYLKKLISELELIENTNFIGFVPSYDDLYLHIAKSKILILPTHHDVIPSSVVESMFIGVPVISNQIGGLPDLNKEKQTCILLKKGDINELSVTIINLLGDKKKQELLIGNAREMVERDFDAAQTTERLVEIYRSKLARLHL
jgi:glycosyltransferase involved in cell wall biosynthesis